MLVAVLQGGLTALVSGWVLTSAVLIAYTLIKMTQHHFAMRRTLAEIHALPEHCDTH